MNNFSRTILTSTTSAATSSMFSITKNKQDIAVCVFGLATTEKAYLQKLDTISGTLKDYPINGAVPYCDVNSAPIIVDIPGVFAIRKDATAGSVGITIESVYAMSVI